MLVMWAPPPLSVLSLLLSSLTYLLPPDEVKSSKAQNPLRAPAYLLYRSLSSLTVAGDGALHVEPSDAAHHILLPPCSPEVPTPPPVEPFTATPLLGAEEEEVGWGCGGLAEAAAGG
jgi:hypothetical protein